MIQVVSGHGIGIQTVSVGYSVNACSVGGNGIGKGIHPADDVRKCAEGSSGGCCDYDPLLCSPAEDVTGVRIQFAVRIQNRTVKVQGDQSNIHEPPPFGKIRYYNHTLPKDFCQSEMILFTFFDKLCRIKEKPGNER